MNPLPLQSIKTELCLCTINYHKNDKSTTNITKTKSFSKKPTSKNPSNTSNPHNPPHPTKINRRAIK